MNKTEQHADSFLPPAKPRKIQSRRLSTEREIIEAFGRLMERDGVHGVGVNALVKEAKTGKKQIYEYFGGLQGVAEAWVRRSTFWPRTDDLINEPITEFLARPAIEKLRILVRAYASALRAHPAVAALMAGEFAGPPELRSAVEETRIRIWEEYERLFFADARRLDQDILALNIVLLPAVTYIGLRSRFEPKFFGFDLKSEASWNAVLGMIDRVITLASTSVDATSPTLSENVD